MLYIGIFIQGYHMWSLVKRCLKNCKVLDILYPNKYEKIS